MMQERLRAMLERQAIWQRGRAALPWEEKLRISLRMRDSLTAFRRSTQKAEQTFEAGAAVPEPPPHKQPESGTT
jgi:hypothetical protein